VVVEVPYRVIYGDTDNMGIVYYANYFRIFEMARNEYFRSRGHSYTEVEAQGIRLPVAEAHCKYLKSARYDDLLTVELWVSKARGARIVFKYKIKNEAKELLAEGFTEHAALKFDGKPARLTPEIIELLAPEESSRH